MRFFRPGVFAQLLYPEALFRIKTNEKVLCLTFDDGPSPDTTPVLLDILGIYKIKALFFCTGYLAERYPVLVDLIRSRGHIVGNHGYNHLDGWKTSVPEYVENARRSSGATSPFLFRPPYGHIRHSQYRALQKNFNIVFWDLMPYDFDQEQGAPECLKVLKKNVRPGSVIVLHDKETSSVLSFLDEFIVSAVNEGYRFVVPSFSRKELTSL